MTNLERIMGAISDVAQSEEFEQFRTDASDFVSAREQGESAGTQIRQMSVSIDDAAETLNRSFPHREQSGRFINVVCPVVVPRRTRSWWWVFVTILGILLGLVGVFFTSVIDAVLSVIPFLGSGSVALTWFGPHYWLLLLAYVFFSIWRNSYVMIPDGCQALVTEFGKLVSMPGAGRLMLYSPWRNVSYIVNTTREYPYNAPIREAPTRERVNASVDLFLQFRIEDPSAFIFNLGSVTGFSEKLENAISEVTRALIYDQKAEAIYDMVGESTSALLDNLNQQFLPAVRFMSANITHAEPSSQQYRMDLAAPEMVRVAKEAYTYQYELKLRKEQDEGSFNKELASLRETLSEIRAEIARYQAQMDTAREKELNRANAYARQMLIEAESDAQANAALLEAQALDIRAMNSAYFPEILEYRYQQDVLERQEHIADRLPQVVNVGADANENIDFMHMAREMLGIRDTKLFSDSDMQAIRERMSEIEARVRERSEQIKQLMEMEDSSVTVIDEEEEEQKYDNSSRETRLLED
jgi:regulator of protease activity HflC (stomatin/prohibitin superfamily)